MSGKTVTDKRIDAARRKVTTICDQFYDATFYNEAGKGSPPDNQFWHEEAALDDELAKALKPRPLSSMQVRKAFHEYTAAFKRACNARSSNQTHGTDAGGASDRVSVQGS